MDLDFGFGYGGVLPTSYMTATGGVETTDGDYKIHTFLSSGDFEVLTLGDNPIVDFMLIAGGGSGGRLSGVQGGAGGGGAGGLLYVENQILTLGVKPIVIGNGGALRTVDSQGVSGQNSTFLTYTSIGGGGGGGGAQNGLNGGSGGGCQYASASGLGTSGQGFAGGGYIGGNAGCGGGGAGQSGFSTTSNNGANGGIGRQTYINGTLNYFAGGGGGSSYGGGTLGGLGGLGGGGNGGINAVNGISGTPNTGGGGGGGFQSNSGAGGSGICIIRYRFQ
jgi:hypothetical protein